MHLQPAPDVELHAIRGGKKRAGVHMVPRALLVA